MQIIASSALSFHTCCQWCACRPGLPIDIDLVCKPVVDLMGRLQMQTWADCRCGYPGVRC